MDLVFLFDGSRSMTTAEFTKNKDFIVDIMNSLQNTSVKVTALWQYYSIHSIYLLNDIYMLYQYCIMLSAFFQFAAVQFSLGCNKVFDFNDYQEGRALDKLRNEPHMKSLTNTHRALKFVL